MAGLLLIKNNQQLDSELNQYEIDTNKKQFESSLASYIRDVWEQNKRAKLDVEQRLLKSLRQRNGEYDPAKLAMIKLTEGSEIFSMLTYIKCVAAEAWLAESYSTVRGKSWSLAATPIPELLPEIINKINNRVLDQIYIATQVYQIETGVEVTPEEFNELAQLHADALKEQVVEAIEIEAKKAIDKMSKKIDDQLAEGGFEESFADIRSDLVTFGTGIMKGPTPRRKIDELKHIQTSDGEWDIGYGDEVLVEFDRLSPFDAYPEDDAVDIQEGNFIEYMRMSQPDFGDCLGMKGFNDKYIQTVLEESKYGSSLTRLPIDQERANIEGRQGNIGSTKRINIINFWGSVPGGLLLEWGMDESQIPNPNLNYNVNAWLVDGTGYVVKSVLNITRTRPYSKICFEKIPGSFWGKSLPEVVRDDQDMCNATARAIQNNTAFCSLPMSQIDVSKLVDGSNSTKLWAGRTFQTDTKGMNAGKAVEFYQPPSVVAHLLTVFDKFSRSADEKSGIPAFVHGAANSGSIANTASGFSMFISMAGKIIANLIQHIDRKCVATIIKRTYNYNMIYDKDPSIKGDANVVVRGSSSLIVKEQEEIRKAEFMRDTNNPVDLQIMGVEGRKELLRDRINSINSLDAIKIIPDEPIQFFPTGGKGVVPQKTLPTRDVAGNLSGGVEVNQFQEISKKGGM